MDNQGPYLNGWPTNTSASVNTTDFKTINYANGSLTFTGSLPTVPATGTTFVNGADKLYAFDGRTWTNLRDEKLRPYLKDFNEDMYSTMSVTNTPSLATDFLQKKVAELENKCKSLEEENRALESAVEGYELTQDKLEERLENQRHSYAELQEAHDELRKVLDGMPMQNAEKWGDYEQRIADLEMALTETEARLTAEAQHGKNVIGIRDGDRFYPLNDEDEFRYPFDDSEKQAIRNLADKINEDRMHQEVDQPSEAEMEAQFAQLIRNSLHDVLNEREADAREQEIHDEAEQAQEIYTDESISNEVWDTYSVEEKIEALSKGATVWRASSGEGPLRTIVEGKTKAGLTGGTSGFACYDRDGKEHVIPVTDLVPNKPTEIAEKPNKVVSMMLSMISSLFVGYPAYVQYGWKGCAVVSFVVAICTMLQAREYAKAR